MAERLEDWSFKQTWPVCETGEWKVKHLPLWSLNLTFRTCFMLNWVHGVFIFIPWMYCDIIFEENCSSKYSALCMRQWTNTGWRPLTATHSSAKSLSSAAGVFQSWAGCCGNSLLWRCQLLAHWSNVEGAVGQAPRVPPQEMLWLDHFHWHLFPLIGTTILLSGNASVATTTFVWHSTMRSNVRNPIMLTPQSPMWSSTAWFWNPLSWSWKTTTYSSLPLIALSNQWMISSSLPSCQGRRTIVTRKHGPLDGWLGNSSGLLIEINRHRTVSFQSGAFVIYIKTCWWHFSDIVSMQFHAVFPKQRDANPRK